MSQQSTLQPANSQTLSLLKLLEGTKCLSHDQDHKSWKNTRNTLAAHQLENLEVSKIAQLNAHTA